MTVKDKYNGKYIAMKSFQDKTIVAYGKIPAIVLKKAGLKGYKDAVLMFIHKKETICIY